MWLALDAATREVVGVYIGARDEAAARKLWESLPAVYRQCAVAYTAALDRICSSVACNATSGSGQTNGQDQLY